MVCLKNADRAKERTVVSQAGTHLLEIQVAWSVLLPVLTDTGLDLMQRSRIEVKTITRGTAVLTEVLYLQMPFPTENQEIGWRWSESNRLQSSLQKGASPDATGQQLLSENDTAPA